MEQKRFFHHPTLEVMRGVLSTRKEIRECVFDGYIIFSYFYTKSDTFGEKEEEYVVVIDVSSTCQSHHCNGLTR
jgi:hypothetical protein